MMRKGFDFRICNLSHPQYRRNATIAIMMYTNQFPFMVIYILSFVLLDAKIINSCISLSKKSN